MENYIEQRALHEMFNSLLWKYSMQHDGDKIDWSNKKQKKFSIHYDASYGFANRGGWFIDFNTYYISTGTVYFITREIAQAAIKEIIFPFIEEHPNFKMASST